MNINEALDELIAELCQVGVRNTEKLFYEIVASHETDKQFRRSKPPRRSKEWHAFSQWLATQDESTKEMMKFVVQETAILSMYNVCLMFDGTAGSWEGNGKVGDLRVQFDVYDSYEMMEEQTPSETFLLGQNGASGESNATYNYFNEIYLNLIHAEFP
jgi:hypothetical protein